MKSRILIIEDNREIRIAWIAALEEAGYLVDDAPNGSVGHEKFKQFNPDLVLLDVRMPVVDGMEVCRLIREESGIPIIMLSAVADEMQKIQALEAGADDYVVKGVGVDELLARVAAHLRWLRKRRDVSVDVGSTWTANENELRQRREELKKSGLTVLIADPDPAERRRVKKVVERNGHSALEAADGDQALALAEFKRPTVMIMEMLLPKISGQKLLLRMNKQGLTDNIAVIVASKVGTPEALAIARVAGAVDYAVKPWSTHEIEFRIGLALNTLRIKRRRAMVARQAEQRKRSEESGNDAELLPSA